MTKDKFITECIKHANTIHKVVDFDRASEAWDYLTVEEGRDYKPENINFEYLDGLFGIFRSIPRIGW